MSSLFGHLFAGLSPPALLALGGVGAAALVALYLLAERRRRVVVAFVPLWEQARGRSRFERLGRRLRRWLSLLLQLTLLALLLFAAADPRPGATSGQGRAIVLLLDRSASMGARHGNERRWDAARRQARTIVEGLGPADQVMVASFARTVVGETAFERDPDRLVRAIEHLALSEEPADLGRALAFAGAVLRGRERPRVLVVTDARHQVSPGPLPASDVFLVPVGGSEENAAIMTLGARRRTMDPGSVDISVVVQNFSTRPRRTVIDLVAGVPPRTVERVPIELGPGARAERTVSHLFVEGALLEARLGDTGDALPLDDVACAVVPDRPVRRVLVVGVPNLYLDGALLSFGPSVLVRRVDIGGMEATRAGWAEQDLVIFDGVTPDPAPPRGRYLYIAPSGASSPFPASRSIASPVPSDFDRRHPVLAQLSLGDLNVQQARALAVAPGDRVLAASFGAPLIVARERPGLRIVALGFDTRRSDLPLRPAFPLLLANVLDWGDVRDGDADRAHRTGTVSRVSVPSDDVEVTDPRGVRHRPPVLGGTASITFDRRGLYRLAAPSRPPDHFACANLSDAGESDLRPPPALTIGGRAVETWAEPPARRHDLVLLALVLAAALSLVEWWSYHRRWTV